MEKDQTDIALSIATELLEQDILGLNNFGYDAVRLNLDTPQRTDEVVAHKLGIGGKDTYHKEKFISYNCSTLIPEDFADWDEGSCQRIRLIFCFSADH